MASRKPRQALQHARDAASQIKQRELVGQQETVGEHVRAVHFEQFHLDHHLRAGVREFLEQHLGRADLRDAIFDQDHPPVRVYPKPDDLQRLLHAAPQLLRVLHADGVRNRHGNRHRRFVLSAFLLRVFGHHDELGAEREYERIRGRGDGAQRADTIDIVEVQAQRLAGLVVSVEYRFDPKLARHLFEDGLCVAVEVQILPPGSRRQLRRALQPSQIDEILVRNRRGEAVRSSGLGFR